jgi:hypothetical protein
MQGFFAEFSLSEMKRIPREPTLSSFAGTQDRAKRGERAQDDKRMASE